MKKVLLLIVSLVLCGSIFAQYESHYPDVDIHQYGMYGIMVTAVSIDGNMITPNDNYEAYEVATFVEGECRGHMFLSYFEGDSYVVADQLQARYLSLPSPEVGKEVTFKLYDHVNGEEYTYCISSDAVVTGVDYIADYEDGVLVRDYYDDPIILSFFHAYTKLIDPYTEDGGYYLIASPIGEVMAKDVVGLRTPTFDFYSFLQNPEDGLEWINHKNQEEYLLQPGVGYLYANSEGEDLVFLGAPFETDGKVTLTKVEEGPNVEFQGWNLVGNPFAETAYLNREFYVMNGDGDEIITAQRNYVNAMEGIFVIANEDDEEIQFTTTPINGKGQIVLNLTEELGNTIDRAIVRFGQGGTLPKFMLNENNTKMYIPKDDKDYAVVRSNKTGKLPVNFKAAQDGVYSISVDVENTNSLCYLHLVDNLAGIDVDLLQNPSYRFDAKTKDEAKRFTLVFESKLIKELSAIKEGDSFSFCNNGNWIINNEGDAILQVVDVNGQILSSEEINGSVSKRIDAAPGVYMLRLINGKDMKVQKIVVE